MNKYESDILLTLFCHNSESQREISKISGYSLGIVNKAINNLMMSGYLDSNYKIEQKAYDEINNSSPKNAVILAAGFGMRMVPINTEMPKAFLEVKGQKLIERLICQLHEAGISKIYIVVGFMKEKFDYLIDKYGVELIVNKEYGNKNNLHSLALAIPYISNTYIIPSDIYFKENPFNKAELYSWYMVSNQLDENSKIRVNRKMEIVKSIGGNTMVGLAYLNFNDSAKITDTIKKLDQNPLYFDSFWEEALYKDNKMLITSKVIDKALAIEINTYEQLRALDNESVNLKSEVITLCSKIFNCSEKEITNINVLKKGMTNRSFLFSVKDEKYIMRIPGEGTDKLINREQEATVFNAISGFGFCDDPVYINPKNGYKITKYLSNVRTCDSKNLDDLNKAMEKLVQFHKMELKVEHTFDIFKQIEFYQSLWNGNNSLYCDYLNTKEKVFSLKSFIEENRKAWCLTHIDAVPDNFLFYNYGGIEKLQLTDWEYAGMQDPHVDIAMFCIYSLYNKDEVDQLIDIYFKQANEVCTHKQRAKIYAYISACGLLWSNWCEYKAQLGVEFGEYSLRQYRFAKDYYKFALEEMNQ